MSVLHIGTATTLATVLTSAISNNDVAYIWLEHYTRKMVFDSISTKAEDIVNHPYYVRPDDYDESGGPPVIGVWIEETGADQYAVWSGEQISAGVISSVNWPTTGSEFDLDNGTIKLGGESSPKFSVAADGTLTATGADISGEITALSGTIGGWSIGTDTLEASTGEVGLSSTITGGDDIRFWAGHATPGSAPFKITEAGVVSASNLIATGGAIGGFTLNSSHLYTGSKTAYNDTNAGIHFGTDGIGIDNNVFTVSSTGALVATSATITGGITTAALAATGGTIGGFTLNADHLYTSSKTVYDDTNAGVHLGTDGIGFGNNIFTVSAAGALVATSAAITGTITSSNLTATGGTIGGFTIDTTHGLYAGTGATRVQMKSGAAGVGGIWTGGTLIADAKNYLDVDGSGKLASGNISWTAAGVLTQTLTDGGTIALDAGADILLDGDSDLNNKAVIDFDGDIQMGSDDNKTLGVWPTTAKTGQFLVGGEPYYDDIYSTYTTAEKRFVSIDMWAYRTISLGVKDDANDPMLNFGGGFSCSYVSASNYLLTTMGGTSSSGKNASVRTYADATTAYCQIISNTAGDYTFHVQMGALGTGAVGINTNSPSTNADLTLEGGTLCIKEITTPTADTNYGKIYTKTDNKIYFQDGAGTEHEIAFV
jgi:hypothetical protein